MEPDPGKVSSHTRDCNKYKGNNNNNINGYGNSIAGDNCNNINKGNTNNKKTTIIEEKILTGKNEARRSGLEFSVWRL